LCSDNTITILFQMIRGVRAKSSAARRFSRLYWKT